MQSGGAEPSDLLSAIYDVEVRNEEKITEADRLFCQQQQDELYEVLEQLEHWYALFTSDAKQYKQSHKISYKPNGKIVVSTPYCSYEELPSDYRMFEFKPFDDIDKLVDLNYSACDAFAQRIVRYFNRTYNVSTPMPTIDAETLTMGARPHYTTYVDLVLEHLGGRNFRQTAEDEIIRRFRKMVEPGMWATVKPELKGDRIVFPNVVLFDDFYFYYSQNHIHYNYSADLECFCEGIVFGADGRLNGGRQFLSGFNSDDVDLKRWYDLTTENSVQLRFYKNGRIDAKFADATAAERCYRCLQLNEIILQKR